MELAQYERRAIVPVMNNRLVYTGGEYANSFVDAAADLRTFAQYCSGRQD